MADEKIKITLSTNAEMSGWDATNKAANDFQRKNKDLIQQGVRGVQTLTTAFGDSGLAGTINKTAGVLAGLATGGVWGMIGAAANSALTVVIGYFKEMNERAKAFKEYLQKEFVEGLTGAGEQASALGKQIQEANKEVDDLIKTSNGKISGEAKNAVAKLHVETLQKLTDDMSESAQKVILADEALEAAKITHAANVRAATEAQSALESRLYAAGEEEAQASAIVTQAKNAVAEFENRYASTLTDVRVANLRAKQTIEEMVASGMTYNAAIKAKQEAVRLSEKIEKENAEVLKQHKNLLAEVKTAEEGLESAAKNRTAIETRLAAATVATETARAEETSATMSLAEAKRKAEMAVQTEQEAMLAQAEKTEEAIQTQLATNKIERVCAANKVKYAEYLALYTQLMKDGKTETEAFAELQKKLNEELKKRADAEAAAAALTDDNTKKKKTGNRTTTTSRISVSIGNTDNLANAVGEKGFSWRVEQRKRRDQERQEREMITNLKGNQPKMVQVLKNQLPRAQQEEFIRLCLTKLTDKQACAIRDDAIKSQLIPMSEQRKQIAHLAELVKSVKATLAVK